MAVKLNVEITRANAGDIFLNSTDGADQSVRKICNLLEAGMVGARNVTTVKVRDNAVAATPVTITLASMAAGTVLLINGVPFTAKGSAATSGNNEFDISGGTDTLDATALAAAINASTSTGVYNVLTASSSSAVVTLTPVGAGSNGITVENLGVVATGTYTFTSVDDGDALAINGVTLTAKTTVADATVQWAKGSSDAACATNFAALINSSATSALITKHVRALARSNVVHLFAKYGGIAGNAITTTSADGDIVVSGARLTGGTLAQYEGVQASQTVTISGADGGNYTVTINGVSTGNVVGTNGDDTATAVSITAAINSLTDALVRGHVTAANSAGVITITAVRGGHLGNAITLAATGTGATAGGARLVNGAVPTVSVVAGGVQTPVGGGAFATGGTSDAQLTYTLG